jgi:hypothetical protein
MKDDHISFQQLSDLYDNEIASAERAALLKHIEECPACAREYNRLCRTIRYCRRYSDCCFETENLPRATMQKIGALKRRKRFMMSVPSIAASVLLIAGISLFNTGVIKSPGKMNIAELGSGQSFSDAEQVIDIIRKNNATITQVTDQYIEGTVALAKFQEMRKRLGFRKVAYMPMEDSDSLAGVHWNDAIEQVGLDDGQAGDIAEPLSRDPGASKQFIVFRVYR